jgi:hypothetical protein
MSYTLCFKCCVGHSKGIIPEAVWKQPISVSSFLPPTKLDDAIVVGVTLAERLGTIPVHELRVYSDRHTPSKYEYLAPPLNIVAAGEAIRAEESPVRQNGWLDYAYGVWFHLLVGNLLIDEYHS